MTSRHTIYDTLQRWADEGVVGLDAKPKTNKGVRKATLKIKNEIRKLQENPLLGEYRVHTASCAWALRSNDYGLYSSRWRHFC